MKKMSGDMKGFLIFLSIVFAIIMFICFPKWGCGIFFPRYRYIFLPVESEEFSSKNFKNNHVFMNELNMTLPSFSMFSNDRDIRIGIFTDKPYSVLHIRQMNCYYQGCETVLFNDIDVELPETIKKVDRILDPCDGGRAWATDGDRRYITYLYPNMPVFKAGKILRHKKIGEEFPFQLRIKYSFDGGEEERTCNLHYNVKVIKRELPIFLPME